MNNFKIYRFSKIAERYCLRRSLNITEFQTKKSVANGEIQQTLYHVRGKPWFYPGQKAAFHWLSPALYCSVLLFCIGYINICKRNIKPFFSGFWKGHFSRVFEKANFPHFRHDNLADIQYLKFKLSGQVVTPLLLGMT